MDAALAAAIARLKAVPTADSEKFVADAYARLGVFDQAISHLTRALTLAPNDPALFISRARALRDWGQLEPALADATRAAYFAPRSAEAHNTLGTIQFALNLSADATVSFERALELAPNAPWALNNLCYVALIKGDADAALARCASALEQDPASSTSRNNLALVLAAADRMDEARTVLLSTGDRASGQYNLGIVLMARREYAGAATAFLEACRATPSFDEACRRAVEARTLSARSPSRPPL